MSTKSPAPKAGSTPSFTVTTVPRVDDVADWDQLEHHDNPFVKRAFLSLLESTGCVGARTPWKPMHLVLRESTSSETLAAMPLYSRTDSYGEYIFDWAWAQAASRAGLRYYPKLTSAVPFVPATGPRVLVKPGFDVDTARIAFGKALVELASGDDDGDARFSSAHILFARDDEATTLAAAGLMRRASLQFHWRNHEKPWATFDDFLEALKHDERKQIRRERRRVKESGVDVEVMSGADVPKKLWPTLFKLYTSTSDRKWGSPYLNKKFFEGIGENLPNAVVVTGRKDGEVVAMTLSFEGERKIYGRHWGCFEEIPGLHFELCYYALIERAIARGCVLLEAGAQGEHKLKRGFLPVITHSLHHVVDPDFKHAIERFLQQESSVVRDEQRELMLHSPFKEGAAPTRELIAD